MTDKDTSCSVCGHPDAVWLAPAQDTLCLDCALEWYHIDDSQETEETADLRDKHPCSTCHGSGQYDDVSACEDCDGTGIDPVFW